MMRFVPRFGSRGLTLTELVVVTGFLVALTGLIWATVSYQAQGTRRENAMSLTQSDVRLWLARIVREFRSIGYNPLGSTSFAIAAATSTELRYSVASDTDADGNVDGTRNVGYRLSGTDLQQWLGGSSWRTILSGVSGLTFTYLDANQSATTACAAIETIVVTLSAEPTVGVTAGAAKPEISEHAKIDVRNDFRCS